MADIHDLIGTVGPENVWVQPIDQCFVGYKQGKTSNTMSFVTDQELVPTQDGGRTEKIGFVVWMERDKVQAAFDALREAKSDD